MNFKYNLLPIDGDHLTNFGFQNFTTSSSVVSDNPSKKITDRLQATNHQQIQNFHIRAFMKSQETIKFAIRRTLLQ